MDQTPLCLNEEPPTQFWNRVENYITQGKPVEFRMGMTVCELHQLWDDLWGRGNRIADALNRYAEKLRQRAQTLPRNDKIRLNKRADLHATRAHAVAAIAESLYSEAQEKLANDLSIGRVETTLDDDQREAFFDDIGQRPGIEQTWKLTLQQVADHIRGTTEASDAAGAIASGNAPVYVDASRLDCGMWLPQGDINAAMSLQAEPHKGQARRVKVFRHDNSLWTVLGLCHSQFRNSADAYQLIPEADYNGPTEKISYRYEGELCVYKDVTYRLGPKHEFIAKDRPVAQWQKFLRHLYDRGGHFTSGKTYHEMLQDRVDNQWWDRDKRDYVHGLAVAPNYFQAVELELTQPDFTKWPAEPAGANISEPETLQTMEQLALAFC
jgi:hypothetical protein